MSFKSFSYFLVFGTLGVVLSIACINFIVDPLWVFKSTQEISISQKDFNERVQKTNYLAFKDNNYDAILLGNSRITYINQNDFDTDLRVFNYAVNAMPVSEYDQAIQNFIHLTKKEPKKIIIGVDLFDVGINQKDMLKSAYQDTLQGSKYKLKSLLSLDTFTFSLKNLTNDENDRKQRFYNKFLEKGLKTENTVNNKEHIQSSLGLNFARKYNKKQWAQLKELKVKYKNSEFIVFTPPLHSDILLEWGKDERFWSYYEKWLKDLIVLFGEVNHFMYDSLVSQSYYNFFDTYHFYPSVGKKIAQKITNRDLLNANDDFGILLTTENIDQYLKEFNKGKK